MTRAEKEGHITLEEKKESKQTTVQYKGEPPAPPSPDKTSRPFTVLIILIFQDKTDRGREDEESSGAVARQGLVG